jgi:hypothetical protein
VFNGTTVLDPKEKKLPLPNLGYLYGLGVNKGRKVV